MNKIKTNISENTEITPLIVVAAMIATTMSIVVLLVSSIADDLFCVVGFYTFLFLCLVRLGYRSLHVSPEKHELHETVVG